MRGLSLSYKESIDQVWQAAAVSGFFVVMRLNLILEEMIMEWNFLFFMNSVLLGVGLAMDAFSVSLANGMNEKYEEIKNGLYCGSICILSVPDAYDRMDMCAYDRTGLWTVSEVHSVDRIDFAFVYRRKHDQRICAE